MELIYASRPICTQETFKRLLLLANHISFLDRPSITFPDWGTVGAESPMRQMDTSNLPVKISVHKPSSGPISSLYLKWLEVDLRNSRFLNAFLDGLKDEEFAWQFLQLNGRYENADGRTVWNAILSDQGLREGNYELPRGSDVRHDVSTHEARRGTLSLLLSEASTKITSAMIFSGKTGFFPVTDCRHFSKLLFERSLEQPRASPAKAISPYLGLAVASAVIPDEVLQAIDISAIGEYRERSSEAYKFWTIEIDALATRIDALDPTVTQVEIEKIILAEIRPRIAEYQKDMANTRDKLFGELVKKVVRWEVPILSLSQLAGMNWAQMAVAFAAALTPAVPGVVDYFTESRDIKRRNSMSYLIGIGKG